MKKYAVKKALEDHHLEMMESSIPSTGASTRDERLAVGGPPPSWGTSTMNSQS